MRRDISCSYAPLHQILKSESCPKSLPFLQQMSFAEPFDLSASYTDAKAKAKGEMFFTEQEWSACDMLFSSLGQGDVSEQERRLAQAKLQFDESEKIVRDLTRTKGKPALVIGCSVGIFFVLMLI